MKILISVILLLSLACSKEDTPPPVHKVENILEKQAVIPDLPENYFDDLSRVILYFKPNKIIEGQNKLELIKSYIHKQEINCLCKGMDGEMHFEDGRIVKMNITNHCLSLESSKNVYSIDAKLIQMFFR